MKEELKLTKNVTKVWGKMQGITLIALVITVIVMLILAGVSISALMGNEGLFARTENARNIYGQSAQKEKDELQNLLNEIDMDPKEIAVIGDFVDYKVEVDGTVYDKWRILNFDNNGHMEIVCYNGPVLKMYSDSGYSSSVKVLEEESIKYVGGQYGESARHLGGNPVNSEIYESDVEAVKLFSDIEENKKLANDCWLAARYSWIAPWNQYRAVRFIDSAGELNYSVLWHMDNWGGPYYDYYSASHSIAPVVSLESGVRIKTLVKGDGSYDEPWKLVK